MKKWLILLSISSVIVVAYYLVITYVEYTPQWLAGEKTTVKRGNIRSPISASGRIEPFKRIEIKSEASGPVTKIYVEEGEYVHKGDLLIELDPNEERLNTEKAELQVIQAEAAYNIAQARATQAEDSGILRAKSTTQSADARMDQAEFDYNKIKDRLSKNAATPVEWVMAQANKKEAEANVTAAAAGLKAAYLDAQIAKEQIGTSKTTWDTAKRDLEDARRRLSQTKIVAPSDGMVAKVMVEIGTLVQSGTRSLTGGTPIVRLAETNKLYVIAMVDDSDFGLVRKIAPPSARPQMKDAPSRSRKSNRANPTTQAAAAANAKAAVATTQADDPPKPPLDATKKVKVTVDTFPDEEFWGYIERIDPEGEPHGAIVQYRVHVLLTSPNSYEMLQLGLPAQVEFTAESRENVLVVESRAVKKEGDDYGVYVPAPTPQDKLATRFIKVRTGISDGTNTEILEGSELKEGKEIYRIPPAPSSERGKQ
jgi:multidrug efflux pump subunit AcrA (membrane-fusion protein)